MHTAIDVFSRYLFAHPLTDASAINVAKVLLDILINTRSYRQRKLHKFWELHLNAQQPNILKQ